MRLKTLTATAAAMAVATVPVAAFAAPTNPAASLSLSSARVGAPSQGKNHLSKGATIGIVLALGVVAGGIIAITKDDNPDSN